MNAGQWFLGVGWITLTLCAFITPVVRAADDDPVCVRETPEDDQPPLPDLDMHAFTVEYRANIIDKKYSMRAKESYDSINNKVRMDMTRNGLKSGLLLDYEDNTYIRYKYLTANGSDYNCDVSKLDEVKSDNFNVFGYKKKKTSSGKVIPHVVSSQEILQFARDEQPVYQGNTTLDGLIVDHWQSCITWDDVKVTFTLDYYFTTSGYKPTNPLTPRQIPVRAEIKGKFKRGKKPKSLHHVYEYLDLQAFEELPAGTFSLPEFMMCTGDDSVWVKDFPALPSSMSYTLEKVSYDSSEEVSVDTVMVYSDADLRLVRVDQFGSTSLSDFSTGVKYIMDQNGCVATPIDPEVDASAIEEDGVIKMKDRAEVAYLKQDLKFTGENVFREISALSFAGESPETKDVLEVYLRKDTQQPIGIVVTDENGSKTQYNIFSFEDSAYPLNKDTFDIRRCRKSKDLTDFDFSFTWQNESINYIQNDVDKILKDLTYYAASRAEVSGVQISSTNFDIDEENQVFHWFGSFLGPDPETAMADVENKLQMKTFDEFRSAVSKAIENGTWETTIEFLNKRFAITFTGNGVDSRDKAVQSMAQTDGLYKFNRFKDTCIDHFEVDEGYLLRDSAHDCARACLNSKWVACNVFQYTAATKACQFTWQKTPSVPNSTLSTPGCDFYSLGYLNSFEAFPGSVLVKKEDVVYQKASTAEACARACLEDTSFTCQSFDYCKGEGRCQLYDIHYYSQESNPSKGDEYEKCVHYSRRSLDDYVPNWATGLSLPGLTEITANSLEECAYLCSHADNEVEEKGCSLFSSCISGDSVTCKLVPASKVSAVTFKSDETCNVYKVKATSSSERKGDASTSPQEGGNNGGYPGGAMGGLAVAMLITGVGVGGLTYFLLRRFQVWNGFQ